MFRECVNSSKDERHTLEKYVRQTKRKRFKKWEGQFDKKNKLLFIILRSA